MSNNDIVLLGSMYSETVLDSLLTDISREMKYVEYMRYSGVSKHKHNPREVHNKVHKRRRQQQLKKASRRKNAAKR